jgi:uncharacterized protein (TIGR02996 family)
MTTLGDQQAFLAAISDAPYDMTARGVYADWLDENVAMMPCETCGRSGYQFIYQHPSDGTKYPRGLRIRCADCDGKTFRDNGFAALARSQRLYVAVQAILADPDSDEPRLRCAELFERMGEKERGEFVVTMVEADRWVDKNAAVPSSPGFQRYRQLRNRETVLFANLAKRKEHVPSVSDDWKCEWDRGFISTVSCTLADWLTHGPAICREQPAMNVTVTDRRPGYVERDPGFNCWTWFNN